MFDRAGEVWHGAARGIFRHEGDQELASILVFLGLMGFMFEAGYQWRKWESNSTRTRWMEKGQNEAPLDSMIRKL